MSPRTELKFRSIPTIFPGPWVGFRTFLHDPQRFRGQERREIDLPPGILAGGRLSRSIGGSPAGLLHTQVWRKKAAIGEPWVVRGETGVVSKACRRPISGRDLRPRDWRLVSAKSSSLCGTIPGWTLGPYACSSAPEFEGAEDGFRLPKKEFAAGSGAAEEWSILI